MSSTEESAAPHPRAYLRVGVTGHRLGSKLSADDVAPIRAVVDALLADIVRLSRAAVSRDSWAFSSSPPIVSTVSSLAEGADRIVAQAGLAAGLDLNVILPFPRGEYRADFETAAAAEYDTLLAKAGTVFEIDGRRDSANRAYEAAGLLMLANADIVIAIWDQMPAEGIGGTALIVEHAVAEGVPVILIDPSKPSEPAILWRADMNLPPARSGLEDVPRRSLVPTLERAVSLMVAPPQDSQQRADLKAFFAERQRRWNMSISYPVLLFLSGVRPLRWTDLRVPDHRGDSATRWREYLSAESRNAGISAVVTDTLLKAYSFIDHLSIGYAQIYRSAYVFNFAAAAIAVLLALSSLLLPDCFKPFLLGVEIVLIVSILAVLRQGGRSQWHRCWLEYRRLAEILRHLRVLALMGAAARIDRPGQRGGHGWVSWYARAVEREIPLPNVAVDQAYLSAARDAVRRAEIKSQIEYNHHNCEVMEKAGERMHIAGTLLFWTTLAICVGYLALYFWRPGLAHEYKLWTVALTALFPTLGAAMNAIRAQGDFQSVASRAHETALNLEELDAAMEHEPLEFARLSDRMEKFVDIMMADTAEWHVLFRTRPLSLPA